MSITGATMLADAPSWLQDWARSRSNATRPEKGPVAALGDPPEHIKRRMGSGYHALNERADISRTPWSSHEERHLHSALAFVPALQRDDWLRVGMALHESGWREHGFEIWREWSQTIPEKYNEEDQVRTWESFDRATRKARRVTLASVYDMAKQRGWKPINSAPVAPFTEIAGDTVVKNANERFQELADLSPVEYDRRRTQEAERLGIRVTTLDTEVERFRPEAQETKRAGRPLVMPPPERWPEPVAGGALLKEVALTIRKFVFLPDETAVATALWIVHAHAFEASLISPRLFITSPEKRCGKTTLLRVIHGLVPKPLSATNITAAAVFRTVERERPTLIIDEADTFMRNNEELRGVINSGHAKDGQVIRLVGDDHEPRAFGTYCPTVVAAIGGLPDTIEDRSIKVLMRRRQQNEAVERFREDRIEPLTRLAQMAARWADDNLDALRQSDPEWPGALQDRAADNWRPLLAIADLAGGDWPRLSRMVAVSLSEGNSTDEDSTRTMLLSDIRSAFNGAERLSSDAIVLHLVGLDDRPWLEFNKGRPITKAGLARLLRPFRISPATIRLDGDRTAKGYHLSAFEDAFARYLPPETVTT